MEWNRVNQGSSSYLIYPLIISFFFKQSVNNNNNNNNESLIINHFNIGCKILETNLLKNFFSFFLATNRFQLPPPSLPCLVYQIVWW